MIIFNQPYIGIIESFDILFYLGVLGPAILPSNSRLPLTMGDFINLSCIGHS